MTGPTYYPATPRIGQTWTDSVAIAGEDRTIAMRYRKRDDRLMLPGDQPDLRSGFTGELPQLPLTTSAVRGREADRPGGACGGMRSARRRTGRGSTAGRPPADVGRADRQHAATAHRRTGSCIQPGSGGQFGTAPGDHDAGWAVSRIGHGVVVEVARG